MLEQLAYMHGAPTARGILKAEAADFVVNEDLGFEPCGEGEHIFVRVRKTGENTAWVAGLLADAAGVNRNAVTWAGLKDRHAVTEQWFGIHLPGKAEPDLSVIEGDSKRYSQNESFGNYGYQEQEFKDGELTDVEHDEYTAEADGYTDDDYADVSDDNGSDDEE